MNSAFVREDKHGTTTWKLNDPEKGLFKIVAQAGKKAIRDHVEDVETVVTDTGYVSELKQGFLVLHLLAAGVLVVTSDLQVHRALASGYFLALYDDRKEIRSALRKVFALLAAVAPCFLDVESPDFSSEIVERLSDPVGAVYADLAEDFVDGKRMKLPLADAVSLYEELIAITGGQTGSAPRGIGERDLVHLEALDCINN